MHELIVATEILETAVAEARKHNARRVEKVICHVGLMQQIVPEILTDAFGIAAAGTMAEGAVLEIVSIAPRVKCRACGGDTETAEWDFSCPKCGSSDVRTEGGDELVLASVMMEVDDEG